jgi:hypothetical protein
MKVLRLYKPFVDLRLEEVDVPSVAEGLRRAV